MIWLKVTDARRVIVRCTTHSRVFMFRRLFLAPIGILVAGAAAAATPDDGWRLFRQSETPRIYAITRQMRTNLNVHSLVLACEEVEERKILQLQIYPANPEPILPRGASPDDMKGQPRAEMTIDGRTFPVMVAFGGDYAVLADREEESLPYLSAALAAALESGQVLMLRFDLVREAEGQPPALDGELEVDLTAGEGRSALAAVHQGCGNR